MIRFNTSILTSTLTPANVKTSHIVAIIHYLRTVINLEPTAYVITDVPTRREALAAFLSSVLLSLAAIALGIFQIHTAVSKPLVRLYGAVDALVIVGLMTLVTAALSSRTVCYGG